MSASCEPGRAPLEGGSEMGAGATEDMDGQGQGSSGSESRSGHSLHSSNGQDSALLESSESNKSTNSHSPSPPSSSVAYSLLSTGSEQDNPSTSGCSSEQSARVKTQKELMKALKEMKIRLPSEKRGKGQSGTLATLQYALSCVKQVQASHDYYQQWTVDGSRPRDATSYTVGELQSITSEYTCKNPDTFAVAVSYVTGKILYVSEQAAPLLRCKRDDFKGAAFADFLAPQDVSVFYGSTAPDHLPSWGACTSPTAAAVDYTPEKSLFCRIRRLFLSGGRTRGRELCYSPFRLTPYLAQVRPTDTAEGHPCCLLIAERIHSGYEAPRIPPDKRIFITRHTPSCLFQDVDERAAPLLGYLPQDLIGKPVLFYLHPEDRPLMLAIHKKILQYGGQPFDHSPLRFCARNGEYVTIDTSWSSFVNPWSRKVSFVMGRHKVRTSPLNEDVFTAPKTLRTLEPNIQEISEQVHRLLLQPVHSSASHEQFLSAASSSSSNGLPTEEGPAQRPMTFQQFCKDVHMVKNRGQQAFIESRTKPPAAPVPPAGREVPKHSCGSGRGTPCEPEPGPDRGAASEESLRKESSSYSYQQINCLDGIIRYLESYNIPSRVKRKCGSSSYTSSSNSDDGRQKADEEAAGSAKDAAEEMCPESEERPGPPSGPVAGPPLAPLAVSGQAESVVSGTSQCSFTSTIVHVGDKKPLDSEAALTEEPPGPERYRRLGLTLEVLSAHTQRAEQLFLSRFKDLSQLHVFGAAAEGRRPAEPGHRLPRRSKCKAKRVKQHRTSESPGQPASWPAAGPCQASPAFPAYSLPGFLPGQPPAPLVAPVVALMLPNYIFPPPCFPAPASFGEPPGSPQPSSSPQPPGSPLFDSRCSSPLQLNLLQMDEAPPGPAERQEAPGAQAGTGERGPQEETGLVEGQDSNNDALSSSSDLLELLLQEDSHSGTGSAASGSGSLGSSSHPGSTSASGTPSSKSSRTSKYFGSVEWSEPERAGPDPGAGAQLVKYVLQDPVWLLMAKSDETLMMTYQLPARSAAAVLREDREKLRQMQKQQPRFTEGQRKELAAVHPWVMDGRLPKAIDVTACLGCSCPRAPGPPSPYAGEVPEGDLSATLEPMDESPAAGPEAAMDHEEAGQLARPEMGAENIA